MSAADVIPEWAIVEIMGHQVTGGRCSEASRFGSALLRVERLDGVTEYYGGSAIFRYRPCSETAVRAWYEARHVTTITAMEPLAIAEEEPW